MKRLAVAALLCAFAGPAVADDHDNWRIGASLVYSDFESDDGSNGNDGGVGFKAHALYKFTEIFGVEGAYYISPEFKGDQTPDVAGGETSLTYSGITVHALAFLPSPVERMEFFGKVGYFDFFDVDLEVDGASADSGSDDGLALGAGISIDAGDNIGVRLELDWYDTSGAQLYTIGLGGEYRF